MVERRAVERVVADLAQDASSSRRRQLVDDLPAPAALAGVLGPDLAIRDRRRGGCPGCRRRASRAPGRARAALPIAGIVASASGTSRLPPRWTKSFCMSTTTSAVLSGRRGPRPGRRIAGPTFWTDSSLRAVSMERLGPRSHQGIPSSPSPIPGARCATRAETGVLPDAKRTRGRRQLAPWQHRSTTQLRWSSASRRGSRWAPRSPALLRGPVRGLHHRHLPQAAPERHQGRRRRAAGADGAVARRPAEGGRLGVRHQPGDDGRPSGARRPPARPRRGVRADRRPEAARDRDRRQRRRPASSRPRPRRSRARSPRPRGHSSSCATSAPWRPGTRSGSAIFMFMIVCTICGYLAADPPRDGRPGPAARAAATRSSRRPPSWCRRSPT